MFISVTSNDHFRSDARKRLLLEKISKEQPDTNIPVSTPAAFHTPGRSSGVTPTDLTPHQSSALATALPPHMRDGDQVSNLRN